MKSNYLFYFCDGIGSVFDSQVITLLNAIQAKNIFNKTYLFLGIRNEKQKNEFLTKDTNPEIEVVFFKSYPNYPIYNSFIRKSIQNALKSQSINFKEVIFHTRGTIISWHLSKVLGVNYNKNIIPDVRGVSVEEITEFYSTNKLFKSFKIRNYLKAIKNLNNFKSISVVSNSLKDYLIKNYNIESKKIVITPCLSGPTFRFVEKNRESTRKEFSLIKGDILIVYSSGGSANWQNDSVLIKLAENGFKVLNLSKIQILHKNIINRFISYNEMPRYLNAADFAIIWRNESIVNKVASPVKFSEFICCGLQVISNQSIDMVSEYIIHNKCGLVLDSFDNITINNLSKLIPNDRRRISESGILHFGIDAIVNRYIKVYELIVNL